MKLTFKDSDYDLRYTRFVIILSLKRSQKLYIARLYFWKTKLDRLFTCFISTSFMSMIG